MKTTKTFSAAVLLTLTLLLANGCGKISQFTEDPFRLNETADQVTETTELETKSQAQITENAQEITKAHTTVTEGPVTVTEAPARPTEVPAGPTEAPVPEKKADRTSSCGYMIWEKDPMTADVYYRAKDSGNIFYEYGDDFWDFWKFSDKGIVGVGKDYINGSNILNRHANTENNAYSEMYAGFRAFIRDGRYLEIEHYYNTYDISCTSIEITHMDGSKPKYTEVSGKNVTADLLDASYTNGFYDISAKYESEDGVLCAHLYMFINCPSNYEEDFSAFICCGRKENGGRWEEEGCMSRLAEINEMIEAKGITAENSLDYNISYPYEAKSQAAGNGYYEYVEDTGFWLDKSDEILAGHEKDSDAYKALLLHDWMTENLIYDSYKVNYLENPRYYGHYNTGLYYLSDCMVGVCRDYVNIYAIMCRKHGIPCIILGNNAKGHVWNAVYLDGEWLEVDLTGDINRYAYTSDVTDVTEATVDNTHCYKYFCSSLTFGIMPDAGEVNSWLHLR